MAPKRENIHLMKQIRCYADKTGLNPSVCYYKRWGTKKRNGQGLGTVYPLRFSKSGKAEIEKLWKTGKNGIFLFLQNS